MPKADWGINPTVIDEFDRSQQFQVYTGPVPPNRTVLRFHVKRLQFVAGTGKRYPQLRVGLECVPARGEDPRYAGFFVMVFRSVMGKNAFVYVPLLDALSDNSISGTDFTRRTITDSDGNIKKIGRWRYTDDLYVYGRVVDVEGADGTMRKDIDWFGKRTAENTDDEDDDTNEYDDEEEDYAEEEEEAEEVRPARKARKAHRRR